MYLPPTTW